MKMYNLENLSPSPEQIRSIKAAEAAKLDKRNPQSRKSRPIPFLKFRLPLWHKLVEQNAGRSVWAMVGALCEAWFKGGRPSKHPNPFPLSSVDTEKWGMVGYQRCRALQFLIQTHLVVVNRSDPQNPLITLTWEPLYPPIPLHQCNDPIARVQRSIAPVQRSPS
jgi:hypothetical protein